jgi:hypothetical protein
MSEFDDLINRLDRRVWITRGARFNAARRLSNKQYWSIASISFLSIYGISIPIIQGALDSVICADVQRSYSVISTISSVFILVLSLLEGSKNYQVRAERLHSSALQLSGICREVEFLKLKYKSQEVDVSSHLVEISNKYERLILECQENHETEDFRLFQIQNRHHFEIAFARAFFDRILLFLKDYWLYIISITVFPVPIIFLYFSC